MHNPYVLSTVTLDASGTMKAGVTVSRSQGWGELLDLFAPPVSVSIMSKGETTSLAMRRTGEALRRAMAKADDRFCA